MLIIILSYSTTSNHNNLTYISKLFWKVGMLCFWNVTIFNANKQFVNEVSEVISGFKKLATLVS